MLTKRFKLKFVVGVLVLALAFLLPVLGCNQQETDKESLNTQTKTADTKNVDKDNSATRPDISPKPGEAKETVTLYFGDKEAMYLIPEQREVVKGSKTIEEVVIDELIKGPENQELVRTLPPEAKLVSIEVVSGVAYVNFSKEFQTKHWGGSTGEAMTLYSITNSLSKLPGIDKVQLLLEGKTQEAILGHADTTEPLAPNWNLVKES